MMTSLYTRKYLQVRRKTVYNQSTITTTLFTIVFVQRYAALTQLTIVFVQRWYAALRQLLIDIVPRYAALTQLTIVCIHWHNASTLLTIVFVQFVPVVRQYQIFTGFFTSAVHRDLVTIKPIGWIQFSAKGVICKRAGFSCKIITETQVHQFKHEAQGTHEVANIHSCATIWLYHNVDQEIIKTLYPFWKLNGPYFLKLEYPSQKVALCQVWLNWPSGFVLIIFKARQCIFAISLLSPVGKVWSIIWQKNPLNLPHARMIILSWNWPNGSREENLIIFKFLQCIFTR